MKKALNSMDELSRRKFMWNFAKSSLGVSMLSLFPRNILAEAGTAPPKGGTAKNVIYIYMNGGMSHIDTFDPKPGSKSQGPTESIKTNVPGIILSQHLPQLAKKMDKIALIRSMTSKTGVHESGTYMMRTAFRPSGNIVHPTMGAWAQLALGRRGQRLPDSVTIGGGADHPGAGFLGPQFSPIPINSPGDGLPYSKPPKGVSEKDVESRMELARAFDESFRHKYKKNQDVKDYEGFYQETVDLLQSEDLSAFDLKKEPNDLKEKYGRGQLGSAALLARRLIENGVRFVEINHGGWDTHNNNFNAMETKVPAVDQAVGALMDDLESRGMLKDTLIVIGSEFGRTPNINVNSGRDHHPRVYSTFFAGGGVAGGQVYGESDENAFAVKENPVQIEDFHSTIAYGMGLPIDKRMHAPNGRPFFIGNQGKPITQIFG